MKFHRRAKRKHAVLTCIAHKNKRPSGNGLQHSVFYKSARNDRELVKMREIIPASGHLQAGHQSVSGGSGHQQYCADVVRVSLP